MTTTPIADYWDEIARIAQAEDPDVDLQAFRHILFVGASAALGFLTGWKPDAEVQIVAINHRSVAVLIKELSAYHGDDEIELYHPVQH